MECSCKGWKKSAEQIFALQATSAITRGVYYTGDKFKFCPWCGADLASQSGVAPDRATPCDCTDPCNLIDQDGCPDECEDYSPPSKGI